VALCSEGGALEPQRSMMPPKLHRQSPTPVMVMVLFGLKDWVAIADETFDNAIL
jgi:hypothetical protein